MIPELGHLALILALLLALAQGGLCLAGAARADAAWLRAGRLAAGGQFVGVMAGFAALVWSFYANDFSVLNVAEHSSVRLPAIYRLTAAWGGHEGSMLLWALILAGWTVALNAFARSLPEALAARALGVMGLISAGLLLFVLFVSNPFLRLEPAPPEGSDLNPLLQDPGMVLHPPLLYLGYAGFAVAFALAVAALLAGRLDAAWARAARPWTLAAWACLTAGIAVGSWWAYTELGWGGWWFWDPTENASLMPWLVGTALVHSLAATARSGGFGRWTLFLALAAFSLSLVGTFLVRSGVLSSVHAFALDPARGLFILIFLGLVIGGSLLLFALRAPTLAAGGDFVPLSREAGLLAGNVLLLVACATVLLGTLYPLVLDALDLGKVSVGPPYFNAVFVPLMAPALLLAGLVPFVRWRVQSGRPLVAALWRPALAALAIGLAGALAAGEWQPQAALGLTLAAWLAFGALRGAVGASNGVPPRLTLAGMRLAHLGLAVGVAGITLVSAFESERNVAMRPGDTVAAGGFELAFRGATELAGPNYSAERGRFEVTKDGAPVAVLEPEKRIYHASKMPMTESAIRYGLTGDLYVALGEPLGGEAWGVRVFHKPFVGWLWAGALLMAVGGLLGAAGRRRSGAQQESVPAGRRPVVRVALTALAIIAPATAGLYAYLGAPALLHGTADMRAAAAADVDGMLAALRARLVKNPGDAEGWSVLGRACLAAERVGEATAALAKAAALAPADGRILAHYAESLALAAGGRFDGRPAELVQQALALAPDDDKALELAGLAAYARQDYAAAVRHWRHLVERLPEASEFREDMARALDEAARRAGMAGEGALPVTDLKLKKGARRAD